MGTRFGSRHNGVAPGKRFRLVGHPGAGIDDAVYVWDVESQETVFVLGGHRQKINEVAFNPDGSYLVSCGDDARHGAEEVLQMRSVPPVLPAALCVHRS